MYLLTIFWFGPDQAMVLAAAGLLTGPAAFEADLGL